VEVHPDSIHAMFSNLSPESTIQETLTQMSQMDQADNACHVTNVALMGIAADCTEIRCHMSCNHNFSTQLQQMGLDCHVSTVDSGADTCVYGDEWLVRCVISKGRHNLVGFDFQAACKKDWHLSPLIS
jgi:hypothetical protein